MIALVVFFVCLVITAYTCVGYPIMLALFARWFGRPWRIEPFRPTVSILIAVRNEEQNLDRRLREMIDQLRRHEISGEIIVASDGSTDRSVEIVQSFADQNVKLVNLVENLGKAAALSEAAKAATGEILVFADARQRWADDALLRLLENFADPQVGAVSGDLVLETAEGVMEGVGMYWRFEKWLRKTESRWWAQIGVTGAISAVRRHLFPAEGLPRGTLLDDVYWPLCVALAGQRVVHDHRARAYDRLPEKTHDEFRRKVRTLAGSFQLVMRMPHSLVPWLNPIWLQWISHKLLRLVMPWALMGMVVASLFFPEPWYPWVFWLQLAGFGLGVLGLVPGLAKRVKLLGAGASFLVLNVAAMLAFWVWVTGRASRSWRRVDYTIPETQG